MNKAEEKIFHCEWIRFDDNVANLYVRRWSGVHIDINDEGKEVHRDGITSYITKGSGTIKPGVDAENRCPECGKANSAHGWIGNYFHGQKICPGDYILKCGDKISSISEKAFLILFGNPKEIKDEIVDKKGQMSLF